jgi:hypothetical protein
MERAAHFVWYKKHRICNFQPAPLQPKTLSRNLYFTAGTSGDGRDCIALACVWIIDGNGLIFIRKVSNDAFCQDVEGAPQEDVIRRRTNDVNLHIERNRAYGEGDISRKAQRPI